MIGILRKLLPKGKPVEPSRMAVILLTNTGCRLLTDVERQGPAIFGPMVHGMGKPVWSDRGRFGALQVVADKPAVPYVVLRDDDIQPVNFPGQQEHRVEFKDLLAIMNFRHSGLKSGQLKLKIEATSKRFRDWVINGAMVAIVLLFFALGAVIVLPRMQAALTDFNLNFLGG